MIADNIKKYRELAGLSQNKLAKLLGISRSSVNAWEMGISTPTTQYVVEMARLFHITTDELITNVATESIQVNNLTPEQKKIIYDLINYFDSINK